MEDDVRFTDFLREFVLRQHLSKWSTYQINEGVSSSGLTWLEETSINLRLVVCWEDKLQHHLILVRQECDNGKTLMNLTFFFWLLSGVIDSVLMLFPRITISRFLLINVMLMSLEVIQARIRPSLPCINSQLPTDI